VIKATIFLLVCLVSSITIYNAFAATSVSGGPTAPGAGGTLPDEDVFNDQATTVNDSQVNIRTISLLPDQAAIINAKCLAVRDDAAAVTGVETIATFKRNDAAAVAEVGPQHQKHFGTDDINISMFLVTSGNDVIVAIFGDSAIETKWKCITTVLVTGNAGGTTGAGEF